jgi:hypothetical protein
MGIFQRLVLDEYDASSIRKISYGLPLRIAGKSGAIEEEAHDSP